MLEICDLSKQFFGRKVLNKINASFRPGRVYSLLGENGAGKTVFFKILSGVYSPDSGTIYLNGNNFNPLSPSDALSSGIAYVPQMPYTPSHLTINQLEKLAGLSLLGGDGFSPLNLNTLRSISLMSLIEKQLLECQIAIQRKPRVLLLDEPQFNKVQHFKMEWLNLLAYCRSHSVIVIIIEHDFKRTLAESDEIILFQHGQIGLWLDSDCDLVTKLSSIQTILGTAENLTEPHTSATFQSNPPIRINLSGNKNFSVISPGMNCILGSFSPKWSEDIQNIIAKLCRMPAFEREISIILGNRADRGLALGCSIEQNLELSEIGIKPVRLLLKNKYSYLRDSLLKVLSEFDVKPRDLSEKVGNLSGGNKQRLAIARAFLQRKKIMICVNPWHGLDINGISYISTTLTSFCVNGGTVIVLTDDIKESAYFGKWSHHWIDSDGDIKKGMPF